MTSTLSSGGIRWRSRGAASLVLLAAALLLCPPNAQAGGSGLNVLIVANQNSTNSLEVANYYRTARQIPAGNVLKISWAGGNVAWTEADFTNTLLNPLLAFVAENQLSDQIQYVALAMDIPYRINGGQNNSTTAALFYGYKAGTTNLDNSYALSENRFLTQQPDTATTNSFLTMMLTADTVQETKNMIDQGVTGDHTFPSQAAWLIKSSDAARNIRYTKFDNAILNSRLNHNYNLFRTNLESNIPWTNLIGCQLGMATFSIAPSTFVPGSIADNFTSFGGKIFENPDQTTLLEFVKAGAAGSYGTVWEPLGVTAKFPDPMVYFYQSRGFSLAECYYQSVKQPFQGLFVGEPLSAPWRQEVSGSWCNLVTNSILQGSTNLCLSFTPDAEDRPLSRVDLIIDGRFHRTVTNVIPQAGNLLTVRLNGYAITYPVPTNASLTSIAAGLTAQINQPANTNVTRVHATAYGDRIELQSFAEALPKGVFEVIDSGGATNIAYLATPGPYSVSSGISSSGLDGAGGFRMEYATDPGVSNVLEASTNLVDWKPVLTNAVGGSMTYVEAKSDLYPQRFYRVAVESPPPSPRLISLGVSDSNAFSLAVLSDTNRPYLLQATSDWNTWSDVMTNLIGGDAGYVDEDAASHPRRYFRTRSGDSNDYAPVSIVEQTSGGANILHIKDTTPGDIGVWASADGTDWSRIYTYSGSPNVQTSAESRSGGGEPVTTRLDAASPVFLSSEAYGVRKGSILDVPTDGVVDTDEYLLLTITTTNGMDHSVGLTNSTPSAIGFATFCQLFLDAVNAEPSLQNADGLVAEDVLISSNVVNFNLRARAAGRPASKIQVMLNAPFPGLAVSPYSKVELNGNASDLLARNHLYVREGVLQLVHSFSLDTTALPDGHHTLTAVAYEGTHVHSQTLNSLPVIIANSSLTATLALAEPGSTLAVDDTIDLVVTANTNAIEKILLFTTGGMYAGTTNQPAAYFQVKGTDLGVGTHPFHALVTTTNGLSYRTETLTVTLVR